MLDPKTNALIQILVANGKQELADRLAALKPSNDIERLVLRAVGDALTNHVPVEAIADQLSAFFDDGGAVILDFSDLELASQLMEAQTRMHKSERGAVKDFITRVVDAIAPALQALGGALVSAVIAS